MNRRRKIIIEPDGKTFHTYCPQLRGLHTCGNTEEEALANCKDAIEAWELSLKLHNEVEDTLEEHVPGDLCMDGEHLCVLVKIGQSTDNIASKFLNQVNLLKSFGWFLDFEEPNLFFSSTDYLFNNSNSWKCNVFSRNLDAVEWM